MIWRGVWLSEQVTLRLMTLVCHKYACQPASMQSPAWVCGYLPVGLQDWCETGAAAGGITVNSSYYHSALGVDVPPWNLSVVWSAPFERFDNVGQAVWTLFQVGTGKAWLYTSVCARSGDKNHFKCSVSPHLLPWESRQRLHRAYDLLAFRVPPAACGRSRAL
jgi:hypothetical protein